MKYYYKNENRVIESTEMLSRFGSQHPIRNTGVYRLSMQPSFVPTSFEEVSKGVYSPIE